MESSLLRSSEAGRSKKASTSWPQDCQTCAMKFFSRSSAGNEKLVSILRKGYHFGLAEMITGAASAVTLIASRPTIILTMNKDALEKVLLKDADICYRLMQTMARTIFSLTRELERSSFENVYTRLARLLLKSRSPRSELVQPAGRTRKISHEELAVQLGVSRETVSRTLSDFRHRGLIDTAYRTITVLNPDGLMEYIEDYDQW
ncbi:MAG: Global nitrogen regulator [Planctomycetes bacterium ADurb.Bin412]|nr:MAG: Global nitrogen regulator [Planctomycetes bacterium ADurb.Bin412]